MLNVRDKEGEMAAVMLKQMLRANSVSSGEGYGYVRSNEALWPRSQPSERPFAVIARLFSFSGKTAYSLLEL